MSSKPLWIECTQWLPCSVQKTFRGSRWQMFFKIGVLKNFANNTGKHLCWSLFLIRFQAFRPSKIPFFTEHLQWKTFFLLQRKDALRASLVKEWHEKCFFLILSQSFLEIIYLDTSASVVTESLSMFDRALKYD